MSDADDQRFRYDPGWLLEVKIGIASGVGVAGLGVYQLLFVEPVMSLEGAAVFLVLLAVGGTLTWILGRYHRELDHEIEVTSQGLFKVKEEADMDHLYWIDVRRVQYRRLWSRVEVHGRSTRFIVGDRLENWNGLLHLIRQRTGRDVEKTWW